MKPNMTRLVAVVIAFGILVGGSFGAGTVYGRSTSSSPAAQAPTGAGAFRTPGAGGRGSFSGTPGALSGTPGAFSFSGTPGPGGGFGAGRQITGTVQSVNGNTLSITVQGGTQISVTLADTTKFGNVSAGDKTALAAGGSVLVVGQRQADGSTSATSVLVLPAGFLGQ
jgi:hypothetical protein